MSITIAEVARAAGLSKATASLVLNGCDRPVRISDAMRHAVMECAR